MSETARLQHDCNLTAAKKTCRNLNPDIAFYLTNLIYRYIAYLSAAVQVFNQPQVCGFSPSDSNCRGVSLLCSS